MRKAVVDSFVENIFQMRLPVFVQSIVAMTMLSSCYYSKSHLYLQNEKFRENKLTRIENKSEPYRLQVNDVVSVKVKSTTDSEVSNAFNITSDAIGTSSTPGVLYMDGYSIDNNGRITLP